MKLLILFIIIGFVKVFWADAGRAQIEAGKMLNDTRRAWDSELNKTETNAVRVFNGLISQMTAFKKTVVNAVTSSGDLIYLRNINETLSKQIERVRNRLSVKSIGEVFDTADGFVQELLNSIDKEISNATDPSSKLDSCWDQQKAKIQLTIDNLVKDVRNLVATEMSPVNDTVEKTRKSIDQANSEVHAGYKLCEGNINDFKSCAITFLKAYLEPFKLTIDKSLASLDTSFNTMRKNIFTKGSKLRGIASSKIQEVGRYFENCMKA